MSELNLPACPICHAQNSLLRDTLQRAGQSFTWYECRECGSVLLWMGDDQWAYQRVGREGKSHLLKKPMKDGELCALLSQVQETKPGARSTNHVARQIADRGRRKSTIASLIPWLLTLCLIGFLALVGVALYPHVSKVSLRSRPTLEPTATPEPAATPGPTNTPRSTRTPRPTATRPRPTPTVDPETAKAHWGTLDIRELVKNPDAYTGQQLHYIGEVITIEEDSSVALIQAWATERSMLGREVVALYWKGRTTGIYEGTRIEFWGYGIGSLEGTNAFGAAIRQPLISVEYLTRFTYSP